MKLKCPKCKTYFLSRNMSIKNSKNVIIRNNIMTEICPECNTAFDPNLNGVFDFDNDGVMSIVKDFNTLKLSPIVASNIKNTNFSSIESPEILIETAKSIDKSLYDKVTSYLEKGIAFSTVLTALIYFQCLLIKPNGSYKGKTMDLIENVNKAPLIPNSTKISFIDSLSYSQRNKGITTPKDRNTDDIKDQNLIDKLNDD